LPVAASEPVNNSEYVYGVVVRLNLHHRCAAAAVPVMFTFAGVHVGIETAFDGPVMTHVRLTAPVKPP